MIYKLFTFTHRFRFVTEASRKRALQFDEEIALVACQV